MLLSVIEFLLDFPLGHSVFKEHRALHSSNFSIIFMSKIVFIKQFIKECKIIQITSFFSAV